MTDQNDTLTPEGTGQQPANERTFSQADMDALAAKIRNEARESTKRQIAADYGDLEALKAAKARLDELEAAELSEAEKLKRQIADLTAAQEAAQRQAKEAEQRAERLRVGLELGLPPVMAERLIGDDADAMKADAQRLLDALTEAGRPVLPDIHATEGAISQGARHPKLTPGQRAAARAVKMTDEEYIKALESMESVKSAATLTKEERDAMLPSA